MLSTSLLTPDESVANPRRECCQPIFFAIFFCHKIFFSSKLLPREKKYFLARVLPTPDESVANQFFCQKFVCHKIIGWQHFRQGLAILLLTRLLPINFLPRNIFFSWQQFREEKKYFVAKNWLATLSSGLATLSSGVNDDVNNIDWLPNPQF